MEEKVEINIEEYIRLREEVQTLRSRCHMLQTVLDSVTLALRNGGINR